MANKPYRNKKIAKAIHENCVCCITGRPYPDPHHLIGHGYSGMGTKAPDWAQMALTHELHTELHNHGWKAFESKYGRTQKSMVAETLFKMHCDGFIDVAELPVDDWVIEEMEKLS
jgi:hypothetical protein